MKKEIDLSIIAAMTQERVIGNHGNLPWQHLPGDLRRFMEITLQEGAIIMGRKTYDSIIIRNGRPLPNRKHIVLSRRATGSFHESVRLVGSPEKACEEVSLNGGRACIIGGGEIYKMFLLVPEVRTMYVTIVHSPELTGDVFFPEIDASWKLISDSGVRRWNPEDDYETSFEVYKR